MEDLLRLAFGAVRAHRLRSFLSMLGIAIGIAAVILLTSIGEGTRVYILSQFTQFGTNILAVNPGKAKTFGIPGVLGGTTHKLTIDDAEALARIPGVEIVVPVTMGNARVEAGQRGRSVPILGVTPDVPILYRFGARLGSFWPKGDPRRGGPWAVLGPKLARELFGDRNPLGQFVRVAGARFRVVGVMMPKGQMMGFEIDDVAYIPVATCMKLFNQDELMEIDLIYSSVRDTSRVETAVTRILTDRHRGNEDFEVTTQEAMLDVFGNVMDVITMAVAAIAGISLLVGATGILTMMWIAVGERTSEIGLVRSLGATREQVQALFLAEAAALATLGGVGGIAIGLGLGQLLRIAVPGLPVETPLRFVIAGLAVSLLTGLASGVAPARRAARLDPIEALRAE
ncbi:MAG: ABC transporter permease [Acidobacteria bacterium]|jgi:putative ABC transport system permease protein|nr:ABC transporter permease [Acidobacteriota bacterium]